jgi:Family of unknown function (DUF6481)
MKKNVLPDFRQRQDDAGASKRAMLEKFRAAPGPDDPAVAERRKAREAMLAERGPKPNGSSGRPLSWPSKRPPGTNAIGRGRLRRNSGERGEGDEQTLTGSSRRCQRCADAAADVEHRSSARLARASYSLAILNSVSRDCRSNISSAIARTLSARICQYSEGNLSDPLVCITNGLLRPLSFEQQTSSFPCGDNICKYSANPV